MLICISSLLLIVLFGAALGNVIRGVPLGVDHYFFVPLWTDFRPGPSPGALDWYTVLCAVVTVAIVSLHGALYLILKTVGDLVLYLTDFREHRQSGYRWTRPAAWFPSPSWCRRSSAGRVRWWSATAGGSPP